MGKAKIQFCSRAASSTGCLGSGLRFAQNDSVGSCHEIVGRHTGTGLMNGFPSGMSIYGTSFSFHRKTPMAGKKQKKAQNAASVDA